MSEGEWYQCADGLLLVTDTYEVASGLRGAVRSGAIRAA